MIMKQILLNILFALIFSTFLNAQGKVKISQNDVKILTQNQDRITIDNEGNLVINNGLIELGRGVTKEHNSGKIAYQVWSDGLDIVGAGADINSRKIYFYAQGGSLFHGNLSTTNSLYVGYNGNATLHTRHIDGKAMGSNAADVLHLNWGNGKDVIIGGAAASNLVVHGSAWSYGWHIHSDSRLKKDINPITTEAKSKIFQLRAVSYHWNQENNPIKELQYGFIAQELQTLFPELVTEDYEGYLSVNYTALIPLMISIIQEQEQRIETLETGGSSEELGQKVQDLETENEALMNKINELEQRLINLENQ